MHNHILIERPTLIEVKPTVFNLSSDSAPGSYSFSSVFYQTFGISFNMIYSIMFWVIKRVDRN